MHGFDIFADKAQLGPFSMRQEPEPLETAGMRLSGPQLQRKNRTAAEIRLRDPSIRETDSNCSGDRSSLSLFAP